MENLYNENDPGASRAYIRALRRMSDEERFERAMALCASARRHMIEEMTGLHPERSAEENRRACLKIIWGPDLFEQVFPAARAQRHG